MEIKKIEKTVKKEVDSISKGLITYANILLKNKGVIRKMAEIVLEEKPDADETKIIDSILLTVYSVYGKRAFGLNEEIGEV